jgi:hypothetical protein
VKRVLAACGLWLGVAAACLSERPRPAPPVLGIVLDSITIHVGPKDSVTGTVRAADPDGLDSIWLRVDTTRVGVDGMLEPAFERPFRLGVRAGLPAGTRIAVVLEARDVVGFRSQLDTFVTLAP